MNTFSQETRPSFCVLARSLAWKSTLERRMSECFREPKISWALDIDDLLSEVALSSSVVVIVELTENSVVADCRRVASATMELPRARFFAVADTELKNGLSLIRECGFADCYWSVGRLERLVIAIRKHLQTRVVDKKSIEELVRENLPWSKYT